MLRVEFTPLEIDEAALAFDAHLEVGHGGHFLGAEHTMTRFRDCFYRPMLSSSMNFERWSRQGALDAAARASAIYQKTLDEYEQPPLDDAIRARARGLREPPAHRARGLRGRSERGRAGGLSRPGSGRTASSSRTMPETRSVRHDKIAGGVDLEPLAEHEVPAARGPTSGDRRDTRERAAPDAGREMEVGQQPDPVRPRVRGEPPRLRQDELGEGPAREIPPTSTASGW